MKLAPRLTFGIALGLACGAWPEAGARADSLPALAVVTNVPAELRREFALAPFYQKYVDAGGLPVVASSEVSDAAVLEARYLILQMVGHRPELLRAMAGRRVRFAVMAPTEFTTDLPEHSDLRPKLYWDKRARGLGATSARPAVSCGEENLVGLPGDPYATENILVHEFAHAVHQMGVNGLDPGFQRRLEQALQAARREGRWKNTYAATNASEYFAEGAQSWFDTNRENDHDHNHVNTREELKAYDPALAALCAEVFGDGSWRYRRPAQRDPASPHLAGFEPASRPRFAWPAALLEWQAKFRRGEVTLAPEDAETLVPLAPPEGSPPRSTAGGALVQLYVQSARTAPVHLAWIDPDGRALPRGTLRAAEHTTLTSFAGHVFEVSDDTGKVLSRYRVGSRTSSIVIR